MVFILTKSSPYHPTGAKAPITTGDIQRNEDIENFISFHPVFLA